MRKITALLGFVGVVSMFWACSAETVLSPSYGEQAAASSSGNVSGNDGQGSENGDPGNVPSQSSNSKDTTVVHETVKLSSSYPQPYSSSGPFCWSKECKDNAAAYVPASSSSAISIEVTMSSEVQVPPIITGNTSMTDQRDGKTYKLEKVGSTLWMAENLNFETETGSYCVGKKNDENFDACKDYGRFYILATAKKVCPAGWRLPTEDEVLAADNIVEEEWWTLGGRFKDLDSDNITYGLNKEQGYIWISSSEHSSWRVQPDTKEHEMQAMSAATNRAYNVRCVQDNAQ